MKMPPSSTSSSPASIRSAVDLPEPDGPTSTSSSPSPSFRLSSSTAGRSAPGKTRVARSKRTSAIAVLHLHTEQVAVGLDQLTPQPVFRLRRRIEVVEGEQRCARDRRCIRDDHTRVRRKTGHPRADRLHQLRRAAAHDAAAQYDFELVAADLQPL